MSKIKLRNSRKMKKKSAKIEQKIKNTAKMNKFPNYKKKTTKRPDFR